MTSPIEKISFENCSFWIKREDLLHPEYGGNKWRKLIYNLERAKHESQDTLLTFGGAWSNHIYATAKACADHRLNSIGVIRGEEPAQYSQTLSAARDAGMKLFFVSRQEYNEKNEPFFKAWLHDRLGSFYLVPEGGSNYLGVQGCTEILDDVTTDFNLITCACGTGATLAGIIMSLKEGQQALGFSALKGSFMKEEVNKHLAFALGDEEVLSQYAKHFDVNEEYHFGGYAKTTPELIDFMQRFYAETNVKLDGIYTAKMVYGLVDLIKRGDIPSTQKVLAIHTGGLQGNVGIERRLGQAIFS